MKRQCNQYETEQKEDSLSMRLCIGLGMGIFIACILFFLPFNLRTVYASESLMQVSHEYWGRQLNDKETTIYREIQRYSENRGKGKITVTFTIPGLWSHSEEEIHRMAADMVARAGTAFSYDYPLYLVESYDYRTDVYGEQMTIEIKPIPYYNDFYEEIDEVKQAISSYEQSLSPKLEGKQGFFLVEAIFENVLELLEYSFCTDEVCLDPFFDNGVVHTLAGALLEKNQHRGVCTAYSSLFQVLCEDCGIPCIRVTNRLVEDEEPHSFNMVMLDQEWYLVDATWADQDGMIDWSYFLAGDKVALRGHKLGDQLLCERVRTPFVNVSLADQYFYRLPAEEYEIHAPAEIFYDACNLNANPDLCITIEPELSTRALQENMEYKVSNTQLRSENEFAGEITVDASHTGSFEIWAYNKYLGELPRKTVSVTRYPIFEFMDGNEIRAISLTNLLLPYAILDLPMERYHVTVQNCAYTYTFTREQLEALSEQVDEKNGSFCSRQFDLGVELFTDLAVGQWRDSWMLLEQERNQETESEISTDDFGTDMDEREERNPESNPDVSVEERKTLTLSEEEKKEEEALREENGTKAEEEALREENEAKAEEETLREENEAKAKEEALQEENETKAKEEALREENEAKAEEETLREENEAKAEEEALQEENETKAKEEALQEENEFEAEAETITSTEETVEMSSEELAESEQQEELYQKEMAKHVFLQNWKKAESKYARGTLQFGLYFSGFEKKQVFSEKFTYILPTEFENLFGTSLYAVIVDGEGFYEDCGVIEIQEDGTVELPYVASNILFYEKTWKSKFEFYLPYIIGGIGGIGALLILLLLYRHYKQSD